MPEEPTRRRLVLSLRFVDHDAKKLRNFMKYGIEMKGERDTKSLLQKDWWFPMQIALAYFTLQSELPQSELPVPASETGCCGCRCCSGCAGAVLGVSAGAVCSGALGSSVQVQMLCVQVLFWVSLFKEYLTKAWTGLVACLDLFGSVLVKLIVLI